MKVFFLDPMDYSVFSEATSPNISALGWSRTDNGSDADLYCTRFDKTAMEFVKQQEGKNVLVYTHEPRYSTLQEHVTSVNGNRLLCVNAYTGGQYFDDFAYFAWATKGLKLGSSRIGRGEIEQRKFSILLSRAGGDVPVWSKGKNVDLCGLRTAIGLIGNRRGLVDVYGKNWPVGVSIESSGLGTANWVQRKLELCGEYKINLCPENTLIKNYCTEKLWHALASGCLPVYAGSPTVFEYFPRDSIVDARSFGTVEAMFDALTTMTTSEILERINRARTSFFLLLDRIHPGETNSRRLTYLYSFITRSM